MREQRIEWLDWLKGMGIMLVIIGHSFRDEMRVVSTAADFIYSLIYVFHMPLFFAIAGYLFHLNYKKNIRKPVLEFSVGRMKAYLRPFFSYTILIYVFFYLSNLIPPIRRMTENTTLQIIPITKYFLLGVSCNNPYAFHLWYLLILFLISVYAFILGKIEKKIGLGEGVLILLFSFVLWNFRVLFAADNIMLIKMLLKFPIFFAVGMYYDKIDRDRWYLPVSVISWTYCCLYVCGFLSRSTGLLWYIKNLLLLISTIVIVDDLFTFSKLYCNTNILNKVGKNSLYYFLLHQPFCCGLLGTVLYGKFGCSILITCLVCTLASILFPSIVLWIKSRFKPINKLFVLLFGV